MRRTRDIIRRRKIREKHNMPAAGLHSPPMQTVKGKEREEASQQVVEAARQSGGSRFWIKAGAVAAVLAPLSMSELAFATTTNQQSALIDELDVVEAQQRWAQGIVAIGQAFQDEADYNSVAEDMIRSLYAYDQLDVLFKPTLAAENQFRPDFDDALSYFVGGDIEEDVGFAIRPWSNVRFGEQQIIPLGDSALAMGNYYFTPAGETEETKVEFSFGYVRDPQGDIRIVLHHSSVPYSGG